MISLKNRVWFGIATLIHIAQPDKPVISPPSIIINTLYKHKL